MAKGKTGRPGKPGKPGGRGGAGGQGGPGEPVGAGGRGGIGGRGGEGAPGLVGRLSDPHLTVAERVIVLTGSISAIVLLALWMFAGWPFGCACG